MFFSFQVVGEYSETKLKELNGTKIYFFLKNQINDKSQQLINIILDGNQKSLIARLTREIYSQFCELCDFSINEEINASNVQLAQQFYQYLSRITIELQDFTFLLNLINATDTYQFSCNATTIIDKQKEIFFQVLEQIYGIGIGNLKNPGVSISIAFVEYFRQLLIKKFRGYQLNYKKQKQLFLLQNGDIIVSKFNNQMTIPLSTSRVIHFQKPRFCYQQSLLSEQSLIQIVSEGVLDENFDQNGQTIILSQGNLVYQGNMQSGLLNGEGTIKNQYNQIIYQGNFVHNKKHGFGKIVYNNRYYYGQFNDDMMHGQFQICNEENGLIYYFYRNQQVNKQDFNQQNTYQITSQEGNQTISKILSNEQVSQSICSYKDFNFRIQAYYALNTGHWLFEDSLDYFLDYFNHFFTYSEKATNGQTVIFNTYETSKYINCDYDQKFYYHEIPYQELNQEIRNKKRKVFVMNSQRSHFLVMIEDNKQLHVCDSLYQENKSLEQAFYNLLKLENRSCRVLKCSQQKNGYDCGIFALFYAIQFMKYDNLSMNEMEKKLRLEDPGQIRWQLKQFVKYNHDYILTNF
ncbi:unnamed protein product [Paramecium octaurelia]|uniref:Ubiquitin-like protease family profile domain-containing protein n=1 Tax=Paramecium octaurelia TaxID=43137 RepID=A0A8S1SD73_PAROT|nr:unnamed protein product [Paramecium octaurelia]